MSANRSKVVIESNLKPSQFGKPASIVVDHNNKTVEVSSATCADDEFEKVYENPLEKLKPSPPSHSSIGCAAQAIASFRASVGAENSGNYESNIQILNFDGDVKSGDEKKDTKIGYANQGFDQDFEPYNHANANPNSKYKSNRSSAQDDSNHHLIQLENRASVDREKIISSTIPPNSTNSAPMIEDKADISFKTVVNVIKSLDVNRYATKKTIAQGMLDIALLTANASQLKYILQIGKQHEFYTLMLSLICVSIGLQALVGILYVIVGGLNINKRRDHRAALIINDMILIGVFLISLINVIISGFGIEHSNTARILTEQPSALKTNRTETIAPKIVPQTDLEIL
ncbi:uncharacterized protein LOC105688447 isoform X1 [Athalia rosae]|uniref:uncharacterized protein LOC105688447 isoform X1 n=1 Tax=Athalia rosae TaxID=37344 RepID=UPI00203488FC|nr:uncharacterized protein LOC105688447 isoform X1 [Athalia rosae]